MKNMESRALRLCEPCAMRCHWNHKGVRHIRTGFFRCSCQSIGGPGHGVCICSDPNDEQLEKQKIEKLTQKERRRIKLLNILFPPQFAVVPRFDFEGLRQTCSGWMLCRRVSDMCSLHNAETFAAENDVDIPDVLLQCHRKCSQLTPPIGMSAILNPNEPERIGIGSVVLCKSGNILKEYGAVIRVHAKNIYSIEISSGNIQRFHRSNLQLLYTDVFFFEAENCVSYWSNNEYQALSSSGLSCPYVDGDSWDKIQELGILRRRFSAFDEYSDRFSGKLYYVNLDAADKEFSARTIQRFMRQKLSFSVSFSNK